MPLSRVTAGVHAVAPGVKRAACIAYAPARFGPSCHTTVAAPELLTTIFGVTSVYKLPSSKVAAAVHEEFAGEKRAACIAVPSIQLAVTFAA